MDEPTNSDRAEWARIALMAFGTATRQVKDGILDDDIECIVSDLLSDLRHYCQAQGLDWEELLKNGNANFEEDFEIEL